MVRAVCLGLLLSGCAKIIVEGGSVHRVEGEATTRIIVGVDTSPCDELDQEAKQECIIAIIEIAKQATKESGSEPEQI
jgi:hypothetical protein